MTHPPANRKSTKNLDVRLALHADDLGMNAAVDAGILESFQRGILTSTAVLANGPTAALALTQMRRLNNSSAEERIAKSPGRAELDDSGERFDIGVHLNLTQGRPLTGDQYPADLLDEHGRFPGVGRLFFALLRPKSRWWPALRAELAEQISWVVDQGGRPSHVNGHQYIELIPGVGETVLNLLPRFSIHTVRVPLERRLMSTTVATRGMLTWVGAHIKRHFAVSFARRTRAAGVRHTESFFGTAHAGHMTIGALARRLRAPFHERLLEIGIHPGSAPLRSATDQSADGWHDPLAAHRPLEKNLICSNDLVELLAARQVGLTRLRAA
jgi:chitin disaccharide deacetylase